MLSISRDASRVAVNLDIFFLLLFIVMQSLSPTCPNSNCLSCSQCHQATRCSGESGLFSRLRVSYWGWNPVLEWALILHLIVEEDQSSDLRKDLNLPDVLHRQSQSSYRKKRLQADKAMNREKHQESRLQRLTLEAWPLGEGSGK